MKNRPEEANGQKDQGAGQEARERERETRTHRKRERGGDMFNESNVRCGVCVCARAGGGRRKTEHEKPMDRRFKGAGHAIYTKRGERNLAYKVS